MAFIVATVADNGGAVRYLHAHRRTAASRIADPGSETRQRVALPAMEAHDLSDGGDGSYGPRAIADRSVEAAARARSRLGRGPGHRRGVALRWARGYGGARVCVSSPRPDDPCPRPPPRGSSCAPPHSSARAQLVFGVAALAGAVALVSLTDRAWPALIAGLVLAALAALWLTTGVRVLRAPWRAATYDALDAVGPARLEAARAIEAELAAPDTRVFGRGPRRVYVSRAWLVVADGEVAAIRSWTCSGATRRRRATA